jgi:hypothetical protein
VMGHAPGLAYAGMAEGSTPKNLATVLENCNEKVKTRIWKHQGNAVFRDRLQ